MQIAISTRHGELRSEQQAYLRAKAEKLTRYFDRLMSIEVAVEHVKNAWKVEISASAEHKHDFFASESGATPEEAMDLCEPKIEQQLRKYKERVQKHKGEPTIGDAAPEVSERSEPA